ncbi:MAG TPA: hypothetical protein VIP29_04395, partial [Nitrososphaeraceae archaeon]
NFESLPSISLVFVSLKILLEILFVSDFRASVIFEYIIIVLRTHKTITKAKCDSILFYFRDAKIKDIDTSL